MPSFSDLPGLKAFLLSGAQSKGWSDSALVSNINLLRGDHGAFERSAYV
jgi:hypothetical protein